MTEFDRDAAVEPVGPGDYRAELGLGWMIGAGINGGYLLATVGRALGATVPGKPDPIAISAYFLSASTPRPAVINTRVLREGGSVATVAAAGVTDLPNPHLAWVL